MFNNTVSYCRTPAIKALNATGQQNINFDTLFKVFVLNSALWHIDFMFGLFEAEVQLGFPRDFKAVRGRHGEKGYG